LMAIFRMTWFPGCWVAKLLLVRGFSATLKCLVGGFRMLGLWNPCCLLCHHWRSSDFSKLEEGILCTSLIPSRSVARSTTCHRWHVHCRQSKSDQYAWMLHLYLLLHLWDQTKFWVGLTCLSGWGCSGCAGLPWCSEC
jgi:hypothetical protein